MLLLGLATALCIRKPIHSSWWEHKLCLSLCTVWGLFCLLLSSGSFLSLGLFPHIQVQISVEPITWGDVSVHLLCSFCTALFFLVLCPAHYIHLGFSWNSNSSTQQIFQVLGLSSFWWCPETCSKLEQSQVSIHLFSFSYKSLSCVACCSMSENYCFMYSVWPSSCAMWEINPHLCYSIIQKQMSSC